MASEKSGTPGNDNNQAEPFSGERFRRMGHPRKLRLENWHARVVGHLVAVVLGWIVIFGLSVEVEAADSIGLRHIDSTPINIVLSWTRVAAASEYRLQRSTSPSFAAFVEYSLPATILAHGDTGHSPSTGLRFRPGAQALGYETDYYYRVQAVYPGAGSVTSDVVGPLRLASASPSDSDGQRLVMEGDLWADVVLGQRNFLENTILGANDKGSANTGGVTVDRSHSPNRYYVIDGNHNRILGFSSISPSPEGQTAEIVIGQPNFGGSACNNDQVFDSYPTTRRPTASSLCFTAPGEKSPGEAVLFSTLAVDRVGNLYVPDQLNNRVLRYNKPFETDPELPGSGDRIADEVWGQANFTNDPATPPGELSSHSLSLGETPFGGIDIDPSGNLWVVDGGNSRVLRFPNVNGVVQKDADLVLGQTDFVSEKWLGGVTPDLYMKYLANPSFVRADSNGNVYVMQRGWIPGSVQIPPMVFEYRAASIPPAPNQTGIPFVEADRVVFDEVPNVATGNFSQARGFAYDPVRNGLWIEFPPAGVNMYLYRLGAEEGFVKSLNAGPEPRGIDVSGAGDVLAVMGGYSANEDLTSVSMYLASDVDSVSDINSPLPWGTRRFLFKIGPTLNQQVELTGLAGTTGIEVAGNQLVVTDPYRILFWNDYGSVQTGQAADGEWSYDYLRRMGSPRLDGRGYLWVSSLFPLNQAPLLPGEPDCNQNYCLHAFDLSVAPLTSTTARARSFAIGRLETKEPGTYIEGIYYKDFIHFFPQCMKTNDSNQCEESALWVATFNRGLLRLRNVDGADVGRSGPYVDVVLGRASRDDAPPCEWFNYAPTAESICIAQGVRVDDDGNVWVWERGSFEDAERARVLRFDAESIPENPDATVFGISAAAVYGTGGDFTAPSTCTNAIGGCMPFLPAVDPSTGRMVAGSHYSSTPYPYVYIDYKNVLIPQLVLGDRTVGAINSVFDSAGNLYLGDINWPRVLIYKNPFRDIPSAYVDLRVAKAGTCGGRVGGVLAGTSEPAGIGCGIDCRESHLIGTQVTLTAVPSDGCMFGGWSGACTGMGDCTVTLDADLEVTANFLVLSSPLPTETPTATPTVTATITPGGPTPTPTAIPTLTGTRTSTYTRTITLTATVTATPTRTPTRTATASPTQTICELSWTRQDFAAGNAPSSVAVGDFNHDGAQDLAVANKDSLDVSVLLGTGTGSFGAATSYGAGGNYYSVAAGDFDQDGNVDLAVTRLNSGRVTVLLGTGLGSFVLDGSYVTGDTPISVAVADFNGDGNPDLAVTNFMSNNVSVLLGTGTGSFAAAINYATGSRPRSVAVGDFDADTQLDLAVGNQSSADVSVLLGTGTGAFGTATNYATGGHPYSVAVGDFNLDGKPDLALAAESHVAVLPGTGGGSFGAAATYAAGSFPNSVRVGDLDGDGTADLAVTNAWSGNVSVLLGTGAGSFGTAANYPVGLNPVSLAIAELNGDGRLDLVVTNSDDDDVSVLLATHSCGEPISTPTVTSTWTRTPTLTWTVTPTDTITPGGPTPTPTDTLLSTPTRTQTITPPPSHTPTGAPTSTHTLTQTATSTGATRTLTPTRTATRTATHTPTIMLTETPTDTPTVTPTPTISPTPTIYIGGAVLYRGSGVAVSGVTVGGRYSVAGADVLSAVTDAAGGYVMGGVPTGGWAVVPHQAEPRARIMAGVSSLDATRLQEVLVQTRTADAVQALACDTTGNGTLSSLDAVRIQEFLVGLRDRMPVADLCGSDWLFVPVPGPSGNPTPVMPHLAPCGLGAIEYGSLSASATGQNFEAVLFGDYTGNWTPPGGGGSEAVDSLGWGGGASSGDGLDSAVTLPVPPPCEGPCAVAVARDGGESVIGVNDLGFVQGFDLTLQAPKGAKVTAVKQADLAAAAGDCSLVWSAEGRTVRISLACLTPISGGGALLSLTVEGATSGMARLSDCVFDELPVPCDGSAAR